MPKPNAEVLRAKQEVEALGLDVGTIYRIFNGGWPRGTQLVFADAGVFVVTPGVPGAYLLTDARKVLFR